MKLKSLIAGLAAMSAIGLSATAAEAAYPEKPVTVIVPQAPGGTNDIIARLISDKLAMQLGQPFVVQNKTGAGGNIGTAQAVREPADGYSVLFTISSTQAINPSLYKKSGLRSCQ